VTSSPTPDYDAVPGVGRPVAQPDGRTWVLDNQDQHVIWLGIGVLIVVCAVILWYFDVKNRAFAEGVRAAEHRAYLEEWHAQHDTEESES
jgi:hypothetical protein